MNPEKTNDSGKRENKKFPAAPTGNASNPSAEKNEKQVPHSHQLLDEKAETYLRESGNIEDLPDAQEQQNADDEMNKESRD